MYYLLDPFCWCQKALSLVNGGFGSCRISIGPDRPWWGSSWKIQPQASRMLHPFAQLPCDSAWFCCMQDFARQHIGRYREGFIQTDIMHFSWFRALLKVRSHFSVGPLKSSCLSPCVHGDRFPFGTTSEQTWAKIMIVVRKDIFCAKNVCFVDVPEAITRRRSRVVNLSFLI